MPTATMEPKMKAKTAKTTGTTGNAAVIQIPPLDIRELSVKVTGLTPLIVNHWSEKAKEQIRNKQQGKKVAKEREAKDPEADFNAARYRLSDGRDGFPAIGFKLAMVRAAKMVEGVTMIDLKCMFNIPGDEDGLVGLDADEPEMREDMVRVGMGKTDLRYRPCYNRWSATLRFRYNAALISPESLMSLLERAGAGVGVGEWRPEKDGLHGTFTCME